MKKKKVKKRVETKEERLARWRREAKVWAEELKKTQPANDRPPGFDPDDDNSYPFLMPSDW